MDGTMQATIVCDGSRLIEIDVGMALEFVQGEFIEVLFRLARMQTSWSSITTC